MAQEEIEILLNSDKDLRQQLQASARVYESRNEQLVQENQRLLQVRIRCRFTDSRSFIQVKESQMCLIVATCRSRPT